MVRRSKGGKTSQSSWYDVELVKDWFREMGLGLGGAEDTSGVLNPRSGEPPAADDGAESFVEILANLGARPSFSVVASALAFSNPSGSDILCPRK